MLGIQEVVFLVKPPDSVTRNCIVGTAHLKASLYSVSMASTWLSLRMTLYGNQFYQGNDMKIIVRVALLALLMPALSYGGDKHNREGSEHAVGVEALSHDLRALLAQEMRALQGGMVAILPAYVSGNWGKIEAIAGKMKNSYILKQSLTEGQVKELHAVLPPGFIEKDQKFHYLAGMLEHAAKSGKAELINFYFSEMNESCVSCHAAFATHRFPALSTKVEKDEHAHSH